MKAILTLAFFVTMSFIHSSTSQQMDDKNEILQWYYNLNQENTNLQRDKRQSRGSNNNFDYNNDENDDEWYVFDEVEPQSQPQALQRNNDNQFGWIPRLQQQSGSFEGSFQQFNPNTNPSTTQRPAFPNAGPPRPSVCAENCFAGTTSEYNPVCGSNGVTYNNLAKLECAATCGISVQMQRDGRCAPLLPSVPQPT